MSFFLPGKRPQPRRFSYEPRFYNPDEDRALRNRVQFSRRSERRAPNRALLYGGLLAMLLFLLSRV